MTFDSSHLKRRYAALLFALVMGVSPGSAWQKPQAAGATTPLNPAYLAGMPSVDKVKLEIKGSNPTDTLARQVAVFNILPSRIERMGLAPGRHYGSTTPDEFKFMGEYRLAAQQLSKEYEKAHTPDEVKAFHQLHGRYELDTALDKEMADRLFTSQFFIEYAKVNKFANEQYQAHLEQERRANNPAASAGGSGSGSNAAGSGTRNDPTAVATRRCLELGGVELDCIGKSFTDGLMGMIGINLDAMKGPQRRGLSMGGSFKGDNGTGVSFGEHANIIGCGKLEPESRIYAVTKRGPQILIEISNQPKPLVVAMNPNGQISGPAVADVTGKIITGYRTYTVVKRRVSDNTIVPGSEHQEQEPIYAPKIERCTFAALRPADAVALDQSSTALIAGLFGKQSDEARQDEMHPTPAGVRITGTYSGPSGLRLDFHPITVILDCGEAHVARPYSVQNTADQLSISVANAASPFTVFLRANGAITGSGNVEVSGRVITGTNDAGVVFAPRSTRCSIGTLNTN